MSGDTHTSGDTVLLINAILIAAFKMLEQRYTEIVFLQMSDNIKLLDYSTKLSGYFWIPTAGDHHSTVHNGATPLSEAVGW